MSFQAFAAGERWNQPAVRKDDLLFDDLTALAGLLGRVQELRDRVQVEHHELHRQIQDMIALAEDHPLPAEVQAQLLRLGQQSARTSRVIHWETENPFTAEPHEA